MQPPWLVARGRAHHPRAGVPVQGSFRSDPRFRAAGEPA
jgi:hypothetical protein